MPRQYDPRPRLRDRTTGDLLVLMVAATVCTSVVLGGASLVLIELWDPDQDTEAGLRTVTGIINTLIGLLAGFLAGRTGATLSQQREEEPKAEP